ncbi:hypothetical protein COCNU_13G005080 [Cocos nucifera]|uniref:Uncharacterized protein n=1 Tax=Cocos nucifera TaxID=13894 RepID=A0A8K0ITJ7_COCNU|nr:hypothetical protein COCNU_13G005080 [Cocos nucifera]
MRSPRAPRWLWDMALKSTRSAWDLSNLHPKDNDDKDEATSANEDEHAPTEVEPTPSVKALAPKSATAPIIKDAARGPTKKAVEHATELMTKDFN